MTLTPLLSKMFLANEKFLTKYEKDKWLVTKLTFYYDKILRWTLKHKKVVLFPTLILFIISLLAFSTMGRSFLPEFNEGSLTLSVVTQPGTSLEESNNLGNLIETALMTDKI